MFYLILIGCIVAALYYHFKEFSHGIPAKYIPDRKATNFGSNCTG